MRERLQHDVAPGLPPAPEGKVRLTGLAGLSGFVAQAAPELVANAMLCAVNQAAYLLKRQIESQGRAFLKEGGFTERLHRKRTQARASAGSDKSDGSDNAAQSPAPTCPLCNKPMRQRVAKQGPHAGQSFWGCTGYPECKGTRKMSDASDGSDRSDKSDQGVNE